MPIHLVTGPANSGKASVLLADVRARVQRGEQPLLIVPTSADQARYRRELAENGVALGVRVERFDGLLGEIVACARVGSPPIGTLARERLIARIADARPGFAGELARTVSELEAQRVTPARLRGALRAWADVETGSSPQLRLFEQTLRGGERSTLQWLAGVYARYQQTLARMHRSDRELQSLAALDALRRKPSLWGGRPLSLYGFDDLTELEFDVVETIGAVVGAELSVSLAFEPRRVAFASRAATFQRLLALAREHTELPARSEHYAPTARGALHHLERALFEAGAERVASGGAIRLLSGGSPRAELRLVAGEIRALLDEGIAPGEIAIVHRSPAEISALLAEELSACAIPYAMRRRLAFADTAIGRGLIGGLRCALASGSLGDLLAWLRVPGVLEYPDLADRLEAQALRAGALSFAGARALWESERWPLDRIERLSEAAAAGLAQLVVALLGELERLFAAPRIGAARVLVGRELDEAAALAAGRGALEQLRELERFSPVGGGGASEVLELLEHLELVSGEEPESGRVAIVDPLSLRARRVRMLFVCGMQEGVFPSPPSPPLIGEEQRRALARASGLALRPPPDWGQAERYLLYALASRPQERLTLSWHKAGEDGSPCVRSLFVEEICDLFEPIELQMEEPAGPEPPAAVGDTTGDPASGAIQALRDQRVLAELRERRLWSASSLELWASCPVKWFVERLLAGEQLGPEAEPLARGSLAHAALKATLERLREQTGSARLTPASLATAKRVLGEALAELEPDRPLSVAPERLLGARRRLRRELERYLELSAECPSPLEPTHLELAFGFEKEDDGAPALAPLDLGEGVLIRGRIDRVDRGEGGEAVVYDYKGRSAPPSARWLRERSWQVALYMLAVRQLLAEPVIGGFYQPLAGSEPAARGALDAQAGVELDCTRTDLLEHDQFERLLQDVAAAARDAATEARAGALQPRPDTCAFGGGCAYPTICRCER